LQVFDVPIDVGELCSDMVEDWPNASPFAVNGMTIGARTLPEEYLPLRS
jgi:hypothetical protein